MRVNEPFPPGCVRILKPLFEPAGLPNIRVNAAGMIEIAYESYRVTYRFEFLPDAERPKERR